MAEQELAQAVPGPGPVRHHVSAGAAQVPDRLLLGRGHPDGHELPGPVDPGQVAVGLDPVAGGPRDEGEGHHIAGAAEGSGEQPVQFVAGGPGLVAHPELAGVGEPGDEPPNGVLVVEDAIDFRCLPVGLEDGYRDGVPVDVKAEVDEAGMRDTGHGRLLPYVGPVRQSGG